MPFLGPFNDYKLLTLDNQPESLNIIYSRLRDLIATSGNAALLPITDKPSIASVKAAEAIQASKNDYLTKQFEQMLNEVVNSSFELKNVWNISLYGDIFDWQDEASAIKELIMNGAKGMIPKLLGYYNLTLEDYKGCEVYLDALGIDIKSDAQKLGEKTADANAAMEEEKLKIEKKNVGRPALKDKDVTNDNTGTSKSAGNNKSEIK